MEHKRTIIEFNDAKGVEWRVEYYYKPNNNSYNKICVMVYQNDEIYHDFGDKTPYTKTATPSKTQAKEIISSARRINKERDKRDSKINKILNGTK